MPIKWQQLTLSVWFADVKPCRAVVIRRDGRWTARVEHGLDVHTASLTFQTCENAQAWAERKLQGLAKPD